MTRLSLKDTCLLDVSGELSAKTKAQLQEHVAKFPAAMLEHELVRGQYNLLRSMPKLELSDADKRLISSNIKQGLHKKLRNIEREQQAKKRMKLVYQALAGVSGIAACVVIGIGIWAVDNHIQQERRAANLAALNATVEKIGILYGSETQNDYDVALRDVKSSVEGLAANQSLSNSKDMANLLDALVNVPDEKPQPKPTEPGSL